MTRRWWWMAIAAAMTACGGGDTAKVDAGGEEEVVELPELRKLDFGRDFTLTDQDGQPFDTASLRGQVIFLFFGFTTCPDVCPMTLSKIAQAEALLGDDAARLQTVYVTVDPERDTPEKLKEYLGHYTLPVVGLTGTPEEVKSVAADFGVYYEKAEQDTAVGYLVDHTTLIYLIDPDGKLRYLSQPGDSAEVLAGLVKEILKEG